MRADKNKLELALARRCLSSADLARIAELPRPTVNNVITGRSVRPITLGKIAKALDMDVVELLDQEGA